ncbi:MAG: anaerobic ribonucleoside-triphosphate reductase activating protein [Firmicutes bacterium]|nr:anaerobic ribonucleoside-triphosphate reductase activating protein [Bacillota bacterium]
MKISGLQKLTLLDYPGRVACTVFLGGCNFRCPFCHNSELLGADAEEFMKAEELLDFLKSRVGILEGVCITGGEPTLQKDLPELLRAIKEMGYAVKLDTNGYRPDVMKALVEEGLVDYVAMDIKNSPERYALTCGIESDGFDLSRIEESMRFLMEGAVDYEFRTTVVKPLHDEEAIGSLGDWLLNLAADRRAKALYLQPFVDRDTVAVSGLFPPTADEMREYKGFLEGCAQAVELRGI